MSDCNTYTNEAVGRITDETANRPPFNYAVLKNVIYGGYRGQFAIGVTNPTRYAIRASSDGGSTWTSWIELAAKSDMRVKYTSTESFQAIDPYMKTSSSYLGGSLDSKIHSQISSLPTGMSIQTVSNSGPIYGAILNKTNNSAYAGIVWGYHESVRNTAWLFVYYNSTFILRPLAEEIS